MLVWDQEPIFHIAAGSHPIQEARGHKIICTEVKLNQKKSSICQKPYWPTDSYGYNGSEKVWFDPSTTYRFVVIEENDKGQGFRSNR